MKAGCFFFPNRIFFTCTANWESKLKAFHLLLTSSRAHSVHGGHGLPLVLLRVVALTGAEPIGTVEPPHSVKQPVDDCNTHTDTPCQHGCYQLPLVPFWIIPGTIHIYLFYCYYSLFSSEGCSGSHYPPVSCLSLQAPNQQVGVASTATSTGTLAWPSNCKTRHILFAGMHNQTSFQHL